LHAPRPRRSVLFLPGDKPRTHEKARTLKADGLIFDLEDSVAPDSKAATRARIAASLAAGGYGARELVVRVNGAGTAWREDDLRFVATLAIDGVLLPKVGGADEVHAAERVLDAAGAKPGLAIWCMMETPLAFLNAGAIAASSRRVAALVMGTEDLGKDLHARPLPERASFATALQLCVLAARAHGIVPLDSVYADFGDAAGFAAQCRQGRDLGFAGKTLIHPGQIDAANDAFGPSEAELDAARRVIAAFEAARAAGQSIAALDGKMIEQLHVDGARRLLALAAALTS
jgi:citrate lyase subunit beta/citryl-CoA lyase